MPILDTIVPTKGQNSDISYIENFIAKNKPVPETWFRWDTFFLVKRKWTSSDPSWTTEWNIVQQYQTGNNIYIRDDLCNIYRFNFSAWVYSFTKIFDNNWEYTYNSSVKSKAVEVPYVNGLVSTAVVTSMWTVSPYALEVWSSIFSNADVNRYVYVNYVNNSWAYSTHWGQFIRIQSYVSWTKVNLEKGFVIPLSAWDVIEVYESIDNIVVFNGIQKTVATNTLPITWSLCLFDNGTNAADAYFRTIIGDDILFFDGVLWTVTSGGYSLYPSITSQYEIPDPVATIGIWSSMWARDFSDKIISIEEHQKLIIVFLQNSMSLVRPISSDETSTIYWYSNWLSGVTLYDKYCFTRKAWVPFILNQSKQIWSLTIAAVNEGTYNISFNDQWYSIQDVLDWNIVDWDSVRLFSDNETVNVLVNKNIWSNTYIYRYYTALQWRLPQKYSKSISTGMVDYKWRSYYCIDKNLCYALWSDDLGDDVTQQLTVVWPKDVTNMLRLWFIQQFVFLVWYYDNPLDFDISLDLGWDKFKISYTKDTSWTIFTQRQNLAQSDGTLGSTILWYWLVWGESVIEQKLTKMAVLSFKVWKWFSWYYSLTIQNKPWKNINLWAVETQWLSGNPYQVPLKNVI